METTTPITDAVDWTEQLGDQLDQHWSMLLRPRLVGLTDDEYSWEPVPGCWGVRPRAQATSALAAGGGDLVIDFEHPEPVPSPVTTIAWRLVHVIVGVFGARCASHFGGPPMDYATYEIPATADAALAALDDAYARWSAGVRSLDAAALATPCGPAEGPYAAVPMGGLVLHINREAIHHGAEIALLRDLYAAGASAPIRRTTSK